MMPNNPENGQVSMNFVVEEIIKQIDLHNCPDSENSFLSLLMGSEAREQITHEISKYVQVSIECLPDGFQQNQFCSPAQTKYSTYVNDQVKVFVQFDQKFLEAPLDEQSMINPIVDSYCGMLLEKCQVQLVSFIEGSTNTDNITKELCIELGKLGVNATDNEKCTSFRVPRPLQKRGKKKEKASTVNSVTKKIGFVQVVHVESGKILSRSENMWVRSKSREEMETKKKRSVLASKKNKKRKTKQEKVEEPALPTHESLMSEQFIKDFFEISDEQGQSNAKPEFVNKADFESKSAVDLSFLKPSLDQNVPSSNPSCLDYPVNYLPYNAWMTYPFFPVMNNIYFPNSCNMVPVNNACCQIIPNPLIFDNSASMPCTNFAQNVPEDPSTLKRRRSQLTPTELTELLGDSIFELSPQSDPFCEKDEDFPSPLSSCVWGENSPSSATSQTNFWDSFF